MQLRISERLRCGRASEDTADTAGRGASSWGAIVARFAASGKRRGVVACRYTLSHEERDVVERLGPNGGLGTGSKLARTHCVAVYSGTSALGCRPAVAVSFVDR